MSFTEQTTITIAILSAELLETKSGTIGEIVIQCSKEDASALVRRGLGTAFRVTLEAEEVTNDDPR